MFWPAADSMQGANGYLLQNQRNNALKMPGPYLAPSYTPVAVSINLGLVTVTASARPLRAGGGRSLSPITVTASARPIRRAGGRRLGTATTAAQPRPLRAGGQRRLGTVTVSTSAQPIRRGRGRTLQPVTVNAQARPIRRAAGRTIQPVTVTASALAIPLGGVHIPRVPGHVGTIGIGHLVTASPGRTIGSPIGHLED